jgi:WD40 repeat protein
MQDPQAFGFLAIQLDDPGDKHAFTLAGDPKMTPYRRWEDGDKPEPGRTVVARQRHQIRKLHENEWVNRGELIAMVNPAVAFSELSVAHADLEAAQAEYLAAGKAREATRVRYEAYTAALRRQPGSISDEDYRKAKLEWEKAVEDEKVKGAAIQSVQAKLNKAATTLQMHEIHAPISGVIKKIIKNAGEAVKPLDPIMLIQNPERLKVDGLLELQEALKLDEGMEVEIQAGRPQSPRVLPGHRNVVTCVAVSKKSPKSVIVSGSEDMTLRGWDAATGQERWELQMYTVPHALACSPKEAKDNFLLIGDAAGVVRLLDLDDPKASTREMAEGHRGVVHSVAFRPDGTVCATGGADHSLCLWETATGKLLDRVPHAHRHEVTAVQFAGPDKIVTAGLDNMLNVWEIVDGKLRKHSSVDGRSNEVTYPGVSPDGKVVLFEQGRELRLLNLEGKQFRGRLVNPSDAQSFSGAALFAPDGKTILTNRPIAGGLQLWRVPSSWQERAPDLRQFIWPGVATCAAFDPDGSFAVTGTRDHQVLLWDMPDEKEVTNRVLGRLTMVEKSLDTRSRQVRVSAVVDNHSRQLNPGAPATMVVPLKQPPTPLSAR